MHPIGSVLDLSARLLASCTATRALEDWYHEHRIGGGSVRTERQAAVRPSRPDDKLLDALDLAPGQALRYRHVTLIRGETDLSDCDLWWVPARLGPAMATAVDATDMPFGTILAPLNPRRSTLFEAVLPAGGTHLLEHRAVVVLPSVGGCRTVAMVRELYRATLVPGRAPPGPSREATP